MLLKTLLFLLLSFYLSANDVLKSNYYVESKEIMLSDIVKNPKEDTQLFQIDENRYSLRVKSKKVLQVLKNHGFENYSSKKPYIQFTKKSTINLDKIKNAIKTEYKKRYEKIDITSITVEPRGYLSSMPESYKTVLSAKSHLSNHGTLYIKTDERKKIFFNYKIVAKVEVYEARKELKKGTELSNLNSKKNSIILDKFRAQPLQTLKEGTLESKRRIKKGTVFTQRDVEGLYLVKRGSSVNIALKSSSLSISFSAKALQNARLGDTIKVLKSNGTKVKVLVTGRHRAEVR